MKENRGAAFAAQPLILVAAKNVSNLQSHPDTNKRDIQQNPRLKIAGDYPYGCIKTSPPILVVGLPLGRLNYIYIGHKVG